MIDALFGSKTRVKLLHLFLNNPGRPFYVREITRKIDEQINSVRRELSNMLDIGIITSDSADNKLYHQVNQRYEYYIPLRSIFSNSIMNQKDQSLLQNDTFDDKYSATVREIAGLRLVVFAGVLVRGSTSPVDAIFVGNITASKIKVLVSEIEKNEGREINYSLLSYDEFYYRLSVRDKFITEILNSKHNVIVDKDKVLNKE